MRGSGAKLMFAPPSGLDRILAVPVGEGSDVSDDVC